MFLCLLDWKLTENNKWNLVSSTNRTVHSALRDDNRAVNNKKVYDTDLFMSVRKAASLHRPKRLDAIDIPREDDSVARAVV